ncbi:hypothetical protein C7B76_11910 [filamentous cyanobacterium CCP2]|nr:hypothetical protein C7B76_11910 [filamentous cyanobacterium CCP2]
MQARSQSRYYTPEEYLEWEEQADYKSEYRDGVIIPMTGGITNHNELSLNLAATLKFSLRKQNYRVYMGDVRLWIPRYRHYTYPDVMVIQGEPIYMGTGTTTVMNPILIAEVLSKSTRNYDQGEKFMYYRSISEMREYILIDQKQFHVMQHTQTSEGKWLLTEYEGEGSTLLFNTVELKVPLDELYAGVDFSEVEA